MEKRYLSQFESEMFENSSKCVPQFELNSFVNMATYWVPDLPNIKGISGLLWHPIFKFAMMPHRHDPASI